MDVPLCNKTYKIDLDEHPSVAFEFVLSF